MLGTQYRMHPAITAFPSREFYAGRLHDAPGMAERMAAPWHEGNAGLGPLAFYDVRGPRCPAVGAADCADAHFCDGGPADSLGDNEIGARSSCAC